MMEIVILIKEWDYQFNYEEVIFQTIIHTQWLKDKLFSITKIKNKNAYWKGYTYWEDSSFVETNITKGQK